MGEQIAVVRVKAAEKLVDRAVEAGILLNEPRPREEAAEAFAPARQDRLDKRVAVEAQLGFLLGEVENMRAHGGEAVTPWACDHLRMRLDQPVHSLRYGFAVVQDINRRVRGTDAESRRRFQRFPFSTAECSMYTTAWCGLDDVRWCHGAIAERSERSMRKEGGMPVWLESDMRLRTGPSDMRSGTLVLFVEPAHLRHPRELHWLCLQLRACWSRRRCFGWVVCPDLRLRSVWDGCAKHCCKSPGFVSPSNGHTEPPTKSPVALDERNAERRILGASPYLKCRFGGGRECSE